MKNENGVDTLVLRKIPYEYPARPINLEIRTREFTCICPFSGLPDFAEIIIRYVPGRHCIELKSLKYYLFSFRQAKIFHEHAVNRILEDLVKLVKPREMEVVGQFSIRGGISTTVTAKYTPKR